LHAAGVQTARLYSCASIDRLAVPDVFFALSSFRGRFESLALATAAANREYARERAIRDGEAGHST